MPLASDVYRLYFPWCPRPSSLLYGILDGAVSHDGGASSSTPKLRGRDIELISSTHTNTYTHTHTHRSERGGVDIVSRMMNSRRSWSCCESRKSRGN